MPTPTPTPTPTPSGVNYNTAEYSRSNYATAASAISAYEKGYNGSGVKIGVVDSGINPSLSEFAGKIDKASGDVAGNRGVSDEGGHGTAVSAVAAAARDGYDTMGIAWGSTIVSLRADEPGSCATKDGCEFYDDAIARGIDSARLAGVKVINLSLGGSQPGSTLLSAMQRAVSEGIVLVIAAGNDGDTAKGNNADPFALVPAQQFSGNVIIAGSVGVSSPTGIDTSKLSTFSNKAGTGAQWYLAALGHSDLAPDQDGTYYYWSGTSFAAPTISGAVAILAQAFPNLSGDKIVEILFRTADDLGQAGTDAVFGHGRLNLNSAFQPIGTTSLAGSQTPVSMVDNGTLPAAAGDAGSTGSMGAIILDGYSRAYVLDFAKTMQSAPQPERLAPALEASLKSFSTAAGPVSVAMTIRERRDLKQGFEIERLGIGPDDARKSRILAGQAMVRLDPKTAVVFGIGESAKTIERRLSKAEGSAFLIARDVGADLGFSSSADQSFAVRRNAGPVNVTVSGETGKLWRRSLDDTQPTYRLGSVSIDRRIGSTSLRAGLTRLDERDTLLGGTFSSVLGGGGSNSLFADIEARRALGGGFSAGLTARHGWSSFAGGKLQSEAYAVDVTKQGVLNGRDMLGFRLSQPLRISSGGFGMMLPTEYDYSTETAISSWRTWSLSPSGREIDAELSYGSGLWDGSGWLGGNLFVRRQPGHIAEADNDYGAAIRFTFGF
jgi:hypothetical protein